MPTWHYVWVPWTIVSAFFCCCSWNSLVPLTMLKQCKVSTENSHTKLIKWLISKIFTLQSAIYSDKKESNKCAEYYLEKQGGCFLKHLNSSDTLHELYIWMYLQWCIWILSQVIFPLYTNYQFYVYQIRLWHATIRPQARYQIQWAQVTYVVQRGSIQI